MFSKKSYLSLGIVAVFLCSAGLSAFAYNESSLGQQDLVAVEVTEYLSDGSLKTTYAYISHEELESLRLCYLKAESGEDRFALLKEYGIIPEDRVLSEFEQGMYERAEALGITQEAVARISTLLDPVVKRRPPILLDFFTKVNTVHLWGNSLRVGLSPLIGYLNYLRNWNLPKADFIDLAWGLMGVVDTQGILNKHSVVTFPGVMCLTGFVGYNVKLPFFVHNYYGYAAITFAAGLGTHTVIWFYWLNQLT